MNQRVTTFSRPNRRSRVNHALPGKFDEVSQQMKTIDHETETMTHPIHRISNSVL
jgi:hypothetical protein